MNQISRSELRHRILAALNLEPASSVTSLAEKLGVLRPSLSRAVTSLQGAGLITRTGRVISLNEAGQEELRHLDDNLSLKVKKSTDLAARIILEQTTTEMGRQLEPFIQSQVRESLINNSLMQMREALANSPMMKMREALANSPMIKMREALADSPMMKIGEALANNPMLKMSEALTNSPMLQAMDAITATAHIQTINLDLLQSWQQGFRSPLNHLVLENNVLLGKMMVDLEAISELKAGVSNALLGLVNQTVWTTRVYDAYFLDVIRDFKKIPTFDRLELSLAIPTTGAAFLVGSTRGFVESETLSSSAEEPENLYVAETYAYSEKYVALTPKLEAYLKPLGQHFVDKWEGAWQTLYSKSKDRHSQATHSGRELLMQVLAHLAPDSVFSKEDIAKYGAHNKPTRKMRIKHILGCEHKSSVELIDSMANTLDKMYDVLVGEAHRRDGNNHLNDTIVGQLAALGAALVMLLSLHRNSQS